MFDYLNSIYLGSLATRHSAQVGFCILLIQSTLGSAHLWFFLLGSQSIWVVVFLEIVYLGVLLHDILPKWDCVNYLFCQLCILLMFGSVYLGFCPTGCLPTWILSTSESGIMTFCPRRIVSTIGSVNSAFRSCLVLSSWKFIQLGVFLLEFCPSWESGHMTYCPSRIVSTIGSLNSRFCSRLAYSTWDSIYLGGCLLGICPLESLATWHSAQVAVCPLMVLSTLDSAQIWFCLLGIMFMKEYFYWDHVHLAFCSLGCLTTWILYTWESAHMTISPQSSLPAIRSFKSHRAHL